MLVIIDDKPAGLIGVADPVKETTPEAIRELHAAGLRIVMLTGDSETTAKAVAKKLGIDDVIAALRHRIIPPSPPRSSSVDRESCNPSPRPERSG